MDVSLICECSYSILILPTITNYRYYLSVSLSGGIGGANTVNVTEIVLMVKDAIAAVPPR